MNPQMLQMLNASLPALLGFYRELRAANPNQPALTDAQIIELLGSDSAQIQAKAEAWLAAHPAASNPT